MLMLWTALALAQAPPPIIGGQQAEPGEWPDAVAIMVGEDFFFCTGTLIAPDVVLTAGHCIDSEMGRYPMQVRVGSIDRSLGGELIPVSSKVIFPGYRTGSNKPDLALLVLQTEVQSVEPRPIMGDCIYDDYVTGASVTMAGWGLLTNNARQSPRIMQTLDQLLSDPECAGQGCDPSQRPGGQMAVIDSGRSAAPGDSGGPVYLMSERGPHLVGVISKGVPGYLTLSTRADKFVDWIEDATGRVLPPPVCGNAPVPAAPDIVVRGRKTGSTTIDALDPDQDDSHTFEIVQGPEFGEATVEGAVVSYRADRGFSGVDSLVVRVTDDSEFVLSGEVVIEVQVERGGACSTVPLGSGLSLGAFALLLGLVRRRRDSWSA